MSHVGAYTRIVYPPQGASEWEVLLRECEAHADQAGWEQPADLFVADVLQTPKGATYLGVLRASIPEPLAECPPYLMLSRLADTWTGPATRFVGVVVVYEAWIVLVDSTDPFSVNAAFAARDQRRLGEQPSAQRARVAMLTMMRPKVGVMSLVRFRGEEPGPVHEAGPGAGDLTLVSVALRKLAWAMSPMGAEYRRLKAESQGPETSTDPQPG